MYLTWDSVYHSLHSQKNRGRTRTVQNPLLTVSMRAVTLAVEKHKLEAGEKDEPEAASSRQAKHNLSNLYTMMYIMLREKEKSHCVYGCDQHIHNSLIQFRRVSLHVLKGTFSRGYQ